MNIKFIIILSFILILSCNPHKDEIILIRNHIKECTSDLIKSQLTEKIRTKDYKFNNQKITLSIDTLGKPIFLNDEEPVESIILNYKEDYYTVSLNNGIITVENN